MIIPDITRLIVLLVFFVYYKRILFSYVMRLRNMIENINCYIAGRKISAYVNRACVWDLTQALSKYPLKMTSCLF